jgi:hypothetical protein
MQAGSSFGLVPIWIVGAAVVGLIVLVGAVIATIIVASSRRDDER